MVGDQPRDVIAGQTVGCITFLVGSELVPSTTRAGRPPVQGS